MDSYVPFEHRVHEHPTSSFGALTHMIKACLGAGLFAMPLAIKYCGIVLGFICTIIIAFVCAHGMHLLVKVSRIMCVRMKQPVMNFSQTTVATFATSNKEMFQKCTRTMEIFVNVAIIGCYYGICCVYIVIIASSMKKELDEYIGETDIRYYMLMLGIPLIIIGQTRALKYLMPFSTLGNVLLLTCCVIILCDIFSESLNFDRHFIAKDITHIPQFISIVVFAMEPIGVTLVIENEMDNPRDFTKAFGVINVACAFIGVLYSSIGVLGYVKYGEDTLSSVTLNLIDGSLSSISVQIMITIAVFFSFGLNFYVATDTAWSNVDQKSSLLESIVRFWTVIACLGLAILIPQIGSFIGLVGALFLSALGFIMPAILNIVTLWPDDLGRWKWILLKDVLMILFGLVTMIAGTITSVIEIVEMYRENEITKEH